MGGATTETEVGQPKTFIEFMANANVRLARSFVFSASSLHFFELSARGVYVFADSRAPNT
jgi:hypothetical protein